MFETVASNDPRLDPKITFTGKFWHYTIAYIPPEDEQTVITSWLKGEVISEDVAKAAMFCSAYQGEISVLANEDGTIADNTITPTSYGNAHYKKAAYFLTDDDKTNAISCMKVAMKLFTRDHSADQGKNQALVELIDALDPNDLDEAQMFMATYFDYDTAYTNGRLKVPEFIMDWHW